MLQETPAQILAKPMTGLHFYRELRRFLQLWQEHIVHPVAFKKMTEGIMAILVILFLVVSVIVLQKLKSII